MKTLFVWVVEHVRKQLSVKAFLSVFALAMVCVVAERVWGIEKHINQIENLYAQVVVSFLFHLAVFLSAFGLQLYWIGKPEQFRWKPFLIFSSLAIFLIAFHIEFPFAHSLTRFFTTWTTHYAWTYQFIFNTRGFVILTLPMLAWVLLHPSWKEDWLGIRHVSSYQSVYGWLLLVIFLLVFVASFEPGFKKYYPIYLQYAPDESGVRAWLYAAVYEFFYGLDFFNIELFFRGFLVIGLSRYVGQQALLPMAAVYCVFHFGKPDGEIISSFFGGYILGIWAYQSRSIWSGVLAHVGLAWLMELVAYGQRMLNG